MRSTRQQTNPRRCPAAGYLLLVGLAFTLLLIVAAASGCSSDEDTGRDQGSTTVTAEAIGGSTDTTSSSVSTPAVGSPGPDGVGTVVATSDGLGTYVDIAPDELAAMLENKDFLFINTHIPYEGEIEQTDLFLPYDQAAQQLGDLPADKNAKIVVYCRSDRMSRISVEEWAKAGYTNLYNLDGGFVAWQEAGYELLQK